MGNDKPDYYAIIPAEIRYNQKLTANAKLLFGEITALCSAEGFCWANNRYFSTLYGVSIKTISTWLHSLQNCGVIEMKYYSATDGKDMSKRRIYIVPTPGKKLTAPKKKSSRGVGRKGYEGEEENFSDNNTSNITTNITFNNSIKKVKVSNSVKSKKNENKPSLEELANYCLEKDMYFDYEEFYSKNETQYHWTKPWKESIEMWCSKPNVMPEYYIEQELCMFIHERDPNNIWLNEHNKNYFIKNTKNKKGENQNERNI